MENVFFGEKGITSTSANHIANIAKEAVDSLVRSLENISFVDHTVTFPGSSEICTVSKGSESTSDISEKLSTIQDSYSLISWLREAIKEKERLLNNLEEISLEVYASRYDIPAVIFPRMERTVTFEDKVAQLEIGDRCRFYELNSRAAVLGKFIHPNNSFSKARTSITDAQKNPVKISGDHTIQIHKFSPSINYYEVDALFFALQAEHRKLEAEFNGIKAKIQKEVDAENILNKNTYKAAYDIATQRLHSLTQEFEIWKTEERTRISNLKIIIPTRLKQTFDLYNNF